MRFFFLNQLTFSILCTLWWPQLRCWHIAFLSSVAGTWLLVNSALGFICFLLLSGFRPCWTWGKCPKKCLRLCCKSTKTQGTCFEFPNNLLVRVAVAICVCVCAWYSQLNLRSASEKNICETYIWCTGSIRLWDNTLLYILDSIKFTYPV